MGERPEQSGMSRRRFVGLSVSAVAASLLAACGGGSSGGSTAPTSAPAAAKPTEAAKPTTAPAAASPAAAGAAASPVAGASPAAAGSPVAAASPAASTSPAASASPAAGASPAAQTAAAPAGPLPAAKAGSQLKILLWSHFVPAYDEWLDKFAADWGSKNKVEVKVDHIRNADLPARLAAEASAGAGHDLFEFQAVIQTQTYADRLVDLTDVANAIGPKYGGWVDTAKNIGIAGGQWKAMMSYTIMQPHLYRKDYFQEVGADKFPDDYLTLLDLTAKLKDNGHPCGLPLANTNDANHNWRSVIYSFGGTEQSPDGTKVTLASDETLAAIKYGVDLYNKGMTDEVFSWDDTGNNLLLLSGRGSWVDNATSAYITAKNQAPDVYTNTAIALQPKGPGAKGIHRNAVDSNAWAIWKWANDPDTAKAFLVDWYAQWQEWGKISTGYNSPPLLDMWKKPMPGLEDPNFQIMQDWRDIASVAGYPGPFSSAIEEVNATFVLPNMVLRAVQGDTPENALKWGDGEYKRIFQKHGISNP